MFGKLKEKLKQTLAIFSRKAEAEAEVKEIIVEKPLKEVLPEIKPAVEKTFVSEKKPIAEKPQPVEKKQPEPIILEKKTEQKKLPLTRPQAYELLKQHVKDKVDVHHCLESEAVMRALAERLDEDPEYWGMLGLLHDLDWGLTKQEPTRHLTLSPRLLKEAGFDQEFIDQVLSHGYGFDLPGLKEKNRNQKIEHALACAETVTGLIHAYALMRGTIMGMELSGLKKKFKDKNFAAGVNREIIAECEKLNLTLDDFLKLAIEAIQSIAAEVGLAGIKTEEKKVIEIKPKEEQPIITPKIIEPKIIVPKEETAKPKKLFGIFTRKEKEEKRVSEPEQPIEKEEPTISEPIKETVPELKPIIEAEESTSFFHKLKQTITTKTISAEKFEELFWELELALLENNVSVEVIEKIKVDLKKELVDKPLPRDVETKIEETLKRTLDEILSFEKIDLIERARHKQPYIIAFFGINGSGKTTSIAKLTRYLQNHHKTVVLAACDTFRAAAIQQLEEHADKLGVKMIKHDYGSDAAAVAYDAIKYAEKNKIDFVLIDTAGRLHSNTNLMAELDKIIRVTKPDLKLFVGEAITGNDCIEQAKKFNDLTEMDGAILTKADVDEKGGAPLSIAYTIKKPILFLGMGQRYEDLEEFDKKRILDRLF